MVMNFCTHCGTLLEVREVEERQRSFCPTCYRIHYKQLKVGAGAFIERNGKVLLLQRTRPPFENCWNLPAGYAEADESPDQTEVREVYEEVGLQVKITGLVDVYFFSDDPRGNGILIVYGCDTVSGEPVESAEAAVPTFFAPENIPANLAGGGHNQAILAWQKLRQ
jgi:ADP-ribose pyrophosphatase YjhB (NUDIX family)